MVRTKKKGFINISLKGPEGQQVMDTLTRLLDKVGTRQGDAGPPKPIHKDLKEALFASQRARR